MMCKESYEAIDEGSLSLGLIRLAIPIALSGMLQQLFNSVDVAVIGRFAGGLALAAVGANAANVSLFVMLLTGLSVGPNVLIARLIGAKEKEEISESVHTAILFSILFGLGIMVGGQLLSEALMDWMHTPGEIADGAILYFRIYLLGLPFIALYNFCASILRCIGESKRPLYTLFASGILNVLLNLVFVVAFHMDVAGVATATVLSNVFSAFVLLGILMREQGAIRLDVTKLRLKMQYVGEIVKIGLPSGIQGMLFSLSNLFIQSTLNGYGASAIAGSSTALTFEYITYNIALAFSQACVTFLSRSYGAGDYRQCRRIYRRSLLYGFLFTSVVSLLFTWKASMFAGLFTADAGIIGYAVIRMRYVGLLEGLSAFHESGSAGMRAIGVSIPPAVLTVIGSVCFRILWVLYVLPLNPTYLMLMLVYPASWIVTGAVMQFACHRYMGKLGR